MTLHASPLKARRRTDLWFAVGVVVSVALLAWIVVTMQQLGHDLRTSNDARDALARQVQQLGGKPVAGPPGSRGDPGQSVTGAPGPQGVPGKDAPTITPSPGASGAPGAPGKNGRDGADSQVPGPSGPPGQDATGVPGRDGKDGTDGTDGAAGPPPSGWTYTDGAGVSYDCTPDSDGSTHYTCRATSTPAPSQGRGLLGAGLLASTARYRRL